MITIFLVPESPRWLYAQGRVSDGDNVFARLYSTAETSDVVLKIRASVMVEKTIEDSEEPQGWALAYTCLKALFVDKTKQGLGKRLRLCIFIMLLDGLSGLNMVVAYTARLFELDLRFSLLESVLVSAIIQTAWAGCVLLSTPMLDKLGRRQALMIGTVISSIGLIGFTACISFETESTGWGAMAMLIVFYIGYGIGMLTISWLYPSEILPLHMRHIGEAVGGITVWAIAFMQVLSGPIAIENTGWKIYLLYTICNFLALPFAYFMMVETKGKTLEEIDYALGSAETRAALETLVLEAQEWAVSGVAVDRVATKSD